MSGQGLPRPQPAAAAPSQTEQQEPESCSPPGPGRRIVCECRAINEGTTTRRQWRSRAGSGLPFCSAERSPRPAGIVASMSEPAGRVSTRPVGRGRSEGTGKPALRQGAFLWLRLVKKSSRAPADRVRPERSERNVLEHMSIASTAQARAAKRSRFIHKRTFLSPQERWSPAGRDPPITADRRQPENRTARIKAPGPRPAPGRRIVSGCRA